MNRLYGTLGLCLRAGKLVTGEEGVLKAIRGNKANLVIVTEDSSDNTKKRIINSANYYNIPYFVFGKKQELGRALGKEIRAVVAIIDEGFSNKLLGMYENINNN